MRLPWRRLASTDVTVISWSNESLAFVQASVEKNGSFQVQRFGVERQGSTSAEDLAKRLMALGLVSTKAIGMLCSDQYQLLTIDAPAVAPEELRSAARWQIKDMVEMHLDDITLDVMKVGDGRGRSTSNLFVVAAANALIRDLVDKGTDLRCSIATVDIQDMAQRNLQTELSRRMGNVERAYASITLLDERYAMLTICANEELFYKRRIELGAGFMAQNWLAPAKPADVLEFAPTNDPYGQSYSGFNEYVPGDAEAQGDLSQRFIVEVQRSLDLWERTWLDLPLQGVMVYAGERSAELVGWLSRELQQPVLSMDIAPMFPGFSGGSEEDRLLCWPLLGVLLRTEGRKL